MAYRVEISKTKTAGCQQKRCKDDSVKIEKGELRQGVWTTIQEHSGWKWRHWGCVTPPVLHNWWESTGQDLELVDGFDTLPEDAQEKVKRALEQGHVDDEDWNGDVECNRYSGKKSQSMFLTALQRKALDAANDKPTGKKRSRPAKTDAADEDDDEPAEPAAKKGKKAAEASTDDATPAKKGPGRPKNVTRGLPKKATAAPVDDEDEDEAQVEVAPKKARGRPRKSLPTEEQVDDVQEAEAPSAKKARGRPRKSLPADEEVEEVEAPSAKKARGRPRESVATDVDEEVVTPAKKGRGRPKKAAQPQVSEDVDKAAPKKGRGRPRKSIAADDEE